MKNGRVLVFFALLAMVAASVYAEYPTIPWQVDDIGEYFDGYYTGEQIDGVPNGHGRWECIWTTATYIGAWEDGKRSGFGSFYAWAPEQGGFLLYEGEWADCMQHGEGTAYYPDGTVHFSGRWNRGQPEG